MGQSYLAHDVGEDGTRGSNQSPNDGHQVVVQHEALGAQSPARVGVQDSDHHWHISA